MTLRIVFCAVFVLWAVGQKTASEKSSTSWTYISRIWTYPAYIIAISQDWVGISWKWSVHIIFDVQDIGLCTDVESAIYTCPVGEFGDCVGSSPAHTRSRANYCFQGSCFLFVFGTSSTFPLTCLRTV